MKQAGARIILWCARINHLDYGDNLILLREPIAYESVDLIYLDPPFNSKRDPHHLAL